VSRAHALVLPGLALSAFALFQSFDFGGGAVSYDPYETRLVALLLFTYTTFLAPLLRYEETERRLRALLYAVVAAGLSSALFGIVRQTAQRGEEGFLLEALRPGQGYAQFINKNHFAYLAEMTLGVLLGLVAGRALPAQALRAHEGGRDRRASVRRGRLGGEVGRVSGGRPRAPAFHGRLAGLLA
jgi:hypothetical protein